VQLPDTAGDQLGELAPEVEDDDGAVIRCGRSVGGAALRSGCVERRLEVRLDLGVVRGEDAVPGIGRLTVDGLAPIATGRLGRGRPPPSTPPSVQAGSRLPEVYRPGLRERATAPAKPVGACRAATQSSATTCLGSKEATTRS
jgi:hypothetical protein